VDDVVGRDHELDRPVHRQYEFGLVLESFIRVGEGPLPLLCRDINDELIGLVPGVPELDQSGDARVDGHQYGECRGRTQPGQSVGAVRSVLTAAVADVIRADPEPDHRIADDDQDEHEDRDDGIKEESDRVVDDRALLRGQERKTIGERELRQDYTRDREHNPDHAGDEEVASGVHRTIVTVPFMPFA
jgi:hypothetical protein